MLRTLAPLESADSNDERVAKVEGFSLHAVLSCEAHQRDKRERLCRYIARPALSVQRLSLRAHGKGVYTLKTPYRDGTTQIVFEPIDVVARLAARLPRPRVTLIRYHGVRACNQHWRADITPAGRGKAITRTHNAASPIARHAAMTGAQRLTRVVNIDVETCARCGSPVTVIACIEHPAVLNTILAPLRDKQQSAPAPPLLVPPARAPPSRPVPAQIDTAPT